MMTIGLGTGDAQAEQPTKKLGQLEAWIMRAN
jgi:hypothetical protein